MSAGEISVIENISVERSFGDTFEFDKQGF